MLLDLVVENEIECVARNIPDAEGPATLSDGRLFVVAPSKGKIIQVLPGGVTRDIVQYEGGLPTGMQVDRNDDLIVADMKMGILRVSLDGKITSMVSEFEGKRIRGCNDVYFDSQGNLYFSAPAGSNNVAPVGELYVRLRDEHVIKLDDGFAFSNGLAVSADDRMLVVAETFSKSLYAYDIEGPGRLSKKRLWAKLPGEHRGGPDGMDFDSQGNLLVANWGGGAIEVFDTFGQHIDRIELPFKQPSNLHFAGPGSNELYVTEHNTNAVWRLDWDNAGQMQYGWAM